ncbi:MAG: hypothetical protein KatS3mg022_1110 [Armatimonadota bacterium]|nr:MAG: hypothetical protein KatS3mg022_1110 [Armatimonadota bacterium]
MVRILQHISLRRRLFIGIFLCATTVLAVHTVVAYRQFAQAIDVQASEAVSSRLRQAVSFHNSCLRLQMMTQIRHLSSQLPIVRAVARRDKIQLKHLLMSIAQKEGFRQLAAFAPDGTVVASVGFTQKQVEDLRYSRLFQTAQSTGSASAHLRLGDEVYAAAAAALRRSGSCTGILVAASPLSLEWIIRLHQMTRIDVALRVGGKWFFARKPPEQLLRWSQQKFDGVQEDYQTEVISPALRISYMIVRDEKGTPLAVMAVWQNDPYIQLMQYSLAHSMLSAMTATLLLAVLIAIVQGHPVVNLVRHLTTAAHIIAGGQFAHRVKVSRWAPYDFHLLAESFNLMASQLEEFALRQKHQQSELRKHNELLARLSVTDALTQVGNHRAFQEHLHAQISLSARKQQPLCLMLIDVDYFKQYNDTYGHPQGDTVLREVARLLTENTRTYDFVARYGGEEFAVILPDTDIETATVVAERVREVVEHHPFPNRRITISIGLASWRAGVDSSALIHEADEALYEAKRSGRNRVCLAKQSKRAA